MLARYQGVWLAKYIAPFLGKQCPDPYPLLHRSNADFANFQGRVFTYFPKLFLELKKMIWKASLEFAQMIYVRVAAKTRIYRGWQTLSYVYTMGIPGTSLGIRQVNKESRIEHLKNYRIDHHGGF